MGDLFLALNLFSNINIFKKKASQAKGKYTLCYFPLVGLIVGIVLCLWYLLAQSLVIKGIVAAVIFTLITGNKHFGAAIDKFGKWVIGVYAFVLFISFPFMDIKDIIIVAGVLMITRIMAVFLCIDNEYIREGIYKNLVDNSRRGVVSIITVVWLMAAVALIEMVSLLHFAFVLITVLIIYFIFSLGSKRRKSLADCDINMFIVICELIIFAEMAGINALSFLRIILRLANVD